MKIRLPFTFLYGPKGKRKFTLDVRKIREFVDISDDCVRRLALVFSPPAYAPRRKPKGPGIDYGKLAAEYTKLISTGVCKNKADVARHFGVSRAWVSIVMKN